MRGQVLGTLQAMKADSEHTPLVGVRVDLASCAVVSVGILRHPHEGDPASEVSVASRARRTRPTSLSIARSGSLMRPVSLSSTAGGLRRRCSGAGRRAVSTIVRNKREE